MLRGWWVVSGIISASSHSNLERTKQWIAWRSVCEKLKRSNGKISNKSADAHLQRLLSISDHRSSVGRHNTQMQGGEHHLLTCASYLCTPRDQKSCQLHWSFNSLPSVLLQQFNCPLWMFFLRAASLVKRTVPSTLFWKTMISHHRNHKK